MSVIEIFRQWVLVSGSAKPMVGFPVSGWHILQWCGTRDGPEPRKKKVKRKGYAPHDPV
jgi:hypothetical protein